MTNKSKIGRPIALKYCFVPTCPNNTKINPDKAFIRVPKTTKRPKWFKAVGISSCTTNPSVFCCEDHFNLEKDVVNLQYSKLMGGSLRLRKGVIPHLNLLPNEPDLEMSKISDYEKTRIMGFAKQYCHGQIKGRKLVTKQVFRVDSKEVQELRILSTNEKGIQVQIPIRTSPYIRAVEMNRTHIELPNLRSQHTQTVDKSKIIKDDPMIDETAALVQNLSSYCRTCLQITTSNRNLADKARLFEMLKKVLGFPLKLNENGIFNICKRCETKLDGILEFRHMCIYTHKKYMFQTKSQKIEESANQNKTPSISTPCSITMKCRKRRFASDSKPSKQLRKIKQPRLTNITNDSNSSESTLSADEALIPSKNPMLSNSVDPWVVNTDEDPAEVMIIDPVDPLAITEADCGVSLEIQDPLSLDTPALLQSVKEVTSQIKQFFEMKSSEELNQTTGANTSSIQMVSAQSQKGDPLLKSMLETVQTSSIKDTKRPKIMVKSFAKSKKNLSQPSLDPTVPLTEPFPQTRVPKYIVDGTLNPQPKRRVSKISKLISIIHKDHTYAMSAKQMKIRQRMENFVTQFSVREVLVALEDCKIEKNKPTILYCAFCPCVADNRIGIMSAHMRREHPEQFQKWCYLCNTVFSDIKAHRRERSCSILHSCKFCSKSFKKTSTLIGHLKYHNRRHFLPHLCNDDKSLETITDDTVNELTTNVERDIDSTCASLDALNYSGTNDSLKDTKICIPPGAIKQENQEGFIEMHRDLHEEIQIKEEPESEETMEYTDTMDIIPNLSFTISKTQKTYGNRTRNENKQPEVI